MQSIIGKQHINIEEEVQNCLRNSVSNVLEKNLIALAEDFFTTGYVSGINHQIVLSPNKIIKFVQKKIEDHTAFGSNPTEHTKGALDAFYSILSFIKNKTVGEHND